MYHPKHIIDIIGNNVRQTRNPFGVPRFMINRWHKGLKLPRHGKAMLFTGMMYQFVPYIETTTNALGQFEDTRWADYMGYARHVPGYLSGVGLAMITPPEKKKAFDAILRNIAKVLRASNVNFFYRPEMDDYSGVLLYDLGDQQGFVDHARYVAQKLKSAGIRSLITVDPHTTYALKVLFPKHVDAHFEVHTYFELVDFTSKNGNRRVTLHDPCFYGRYLDLADVPATLLGKIGVACTKVRTSGRFTNCCGGPAESISPKLSTEIGGRRVEELNDTGEKIVAMCPICLGNLQKSGAAVEDLSSVLVGQL